MGALGMEDEERRSVERGVDCGVRDRQIEWCDGPADGSFSDGGVVAGVGIGDRAGAYAWGDFAGWGVCGVCGGEGFVFLWDGEGVLCREA